MQLRGFQYNSPRLPRGKSSFLLSKNSSLVERRGNVQAGGVASAEEQLKKLTLDQKIRQMFVIATCASGNQKGFSEQLASQYIKSPYNMNKDYVRKVVTEGIGGILPLFMTNTKKFVSWNNELQNLSKQGPLLVMLDAEWGPAMRISDAPQLPRAMTLSAIPADESVSCVHEEIGKKKSVLLQSLGVHIDLGPVADINSAENPIIGMRSFGEDKERVIHCVTALVRGTQTKAVKCCVKHCPGHGRIKNDPHLTSAVLEASREQIEQEELLPFKHAIREGVAAIMMAHIQVPALDPSGKPASLSYLITTELLQNQLGFKGLVITDGLGMNAVTQGRGPGQPEFEAYIAGNDILLAPVDLDAAIKRIKDYVTDKSISKEERTKRKERLNRSVLKILKLKEEIFSATSPCIDTTTLKSFSQSERNMDGYLYARAITMVKNEGNIIKKGTRPSLIHCVLGKNADTFTLPPEHLVSSDCYRQCSTLNSYDQSPRLFEWIHSSRSISSASCDAVVFHITGMNQNHSSDFGIDQKVLNLIAQVKNKGQKKIITILYGTPYALSLVMSYSDAVIVAYEEEMEARNAVTSVLYGYGEPTGKLPITLEKCMNRKAKAL